MKKIIIAIAVIVAAYIGMVVFIKSKTANAFEQEVEKLNQIPEINAKLVAKDDGLLTSKALIEISVNDPSTGESKSIVELQQKQSYGPFLLTDKGMQLGWYFFDTKLDWGDSLKAEMTQEELEKINLKELFDIHFISGFNGSISGAVMFKGFDYKDHEEAVAFSAGDISINTDINFKQVSGEASWPGMTISKNNEDGFSLSGVKFDFDQTLVTGDVLAGTAIYDGVATYTIDGISFREADHFFKLDNLAMEVKSSVDDQTFMNISMMIKNALLNLNGDKYTNAEFNMHFNHLDIATLQELGKTSQEMQQAALEGQDVSGYNMVLMNQMMGLLQTSPSIKIDNTKVTTMQGDMTAALDFDVDANKMDPNNPMAFMMAMKATFDAVAPAAYFEQRGMGEMIEQWLQANFVVKDNDQLKVNLVYADGMPLLNGQPMAGIPGM